MCLSLKLIPIYIYLSPFVWLHLVCLCCDGGRGCRGSVVGLSATYHNTCQRSRMVIHVSHSIVTNSQSIMISHCGRSLFTTLFISLVHAYPGVGLPGGKDILKIDSLLSNKHVEQEISHQLHTW